jgi:hypothetical protein
MIRKWRACCIGLQSLTSHVKRPTTRSDAHSSISIQERQPMVSMDYRRLWVRQFGTGSDRANDSAVPVLEEHERAILHECRRNRLAFFAPVEDPMPPRALASPMHRHRCEPNSASCGTDHRRSAFGHGHDRARLQPFVDHPANDTIRNWVNNERSSEKCNAPILPRVESSI